MLRIIKKVISVFVSSILGLCILLCCIVSVKSMAGLDKSVFGFRVFYLISGSMEPTIRTGAAVFTKAQESYEIGDIITFASSDISIYGQPNTHRIVNMINRNNEIAYITKGDANEVEDSYYVLPESIYGKVVLHTGKAKWLGTFIGMLTTPLGFVTIILLPSLAIVAVLMRNFAKAYKEALKEEAGITASLSKEIEPETPPVMLPMSPPPGKKAVYFESNGVWYYYFAEEADVDAGTFSEETDGLPFCAGACIEAEQEQENCENREETELDEKQQTPKADDREVTHVMETKAEAHFKEQSNVDPQQEMDDLVNDHSDNDTELTENHQEL